MNNEFKKILEEVLKKTNQEIEHAAPPSLMDLIKLAKNTEELLRLLEKISKKSK